MLKKKGIFLLCLCSGMCLLGGCASQKALTEEEQNVIAEYSAGILLKHYSKYDRRLEEKEEDAPAVAEPEPTVPAVTPQPTEEPAPGGDSAGGDIEEETLNEVSLDELYRVPGMKVKYSTYVICKQYPKNSPMQLTAKKGQRLVIVQFEVKNKTAKEKKVNLIKRDIQYSLDMDGSVYNPTLAIQKNGGMNYLKTTLKPRAAERAILVFEIPEDSQNPESIVLTVKDGDNASTIQVK